MERGEEPSRKVDRGMEGKALSRESPRFVFSTIFAVLSLAVLYKPIDIFFYLSLPAVGVGGLVKV